MPRKNKPKNSESHSTKTQLQGKLEITRAGMGFVIVEGREKDIIVKRENLGTALNGDIVLVEMRDDREGRRTEGRVLDVIQRKQSEFTGVIEVHQHYAFMIPDNERMPVDVFVPLHLLAGATTGDRVMVKIVDWNKGKNPIGSVLNILTNESANEIAMQGILSENGFPLSFSSETLADAERYTDVISEEEVLKRRDMRDVLTMTIDPVDARDFDDAISFTTLKGGYYEIGVHIADVGHFIEAGSALDKEAYQRATSVYLPDRVLPMLPERLSNELCSLRPNEDKYTFSTVFRINKKGKVTDTWIGKTLIHSKRRFSYEEVQEIIEGKKGDHEKEIRILNEMAQAMRAERFTKGAINFSSQEVRFKLDENAVPIGIIVKESKEAHQLIEEFMLLANRSVAAFVAGKELKGDKVPFPYRVHDEPDADKLKVFSVFALRFGINLDISKPENVAHSFNEMLRTAHGKPEQHVLEQLGIRTMAKAVYTTKNFGHYGLGFENYCHFTSPIRRYPDVLVHRILLQCLEDKVVPIKNLEEQCRHCSDQERKAMECERTANKYKQVEYMQNFLGDEFDAIISGVSQHGFWAETIEHKCEGMVSAMDLQEWDEFTFREHEYALVGLHSGFKFGMGDKIKVKVTATNLTKRQIDFALAEPRIPVRPRGKKKEKTKEQPIRDKKKKK